MVTQNAMCFGDREGDEGYVRRTSSGEFDSGLKSLLGCSLILQDDVSASRLVRAPEVFWDAGRRFKSR